MKKEVYVCDVCAKDTLVENGWHLDGNLDFCSNKCVAKYIEVFHRNMMKDLRSILQKQEPLP